MSENRDTPAKFTAKKMLEQYFLNRLNSGEDVLISKKEFEGLMKTIKNFQEAKNRANRH